MVMQANTGAETEVAAAKMPKSAKTGAQVALEERAGRRAKGGKAAKPGKVGAFPLDSSVLPSDRSLGW